MINKNLTINEAFALAVKNHQSNNFKEAKNLYNQVLKINPDHASAHNNLGAIFQVLKRNQEAISCYEKAIKINPNFTDALNNLGVVCQKLEDYQKAISSYEKIIKIDPNHLGCINGLSTLLKVSTFDNKSHLKDICLFLFRKKNINHNEISHNAISAALVNLDNNQLNTVFDSSSSLLTNEIVQNLLNEELFHLMLQKALIADIFLEKLLTRLRCDILFALAGADKNILNDYSNFIISLAEQCWLNEYIYINSEKENDAVDKLKNKIENDKEINEIEIAILGCYSPLNNSKIITEKLLNYQSENILFNDLVTVQINEPLKEIELKKSIKSLDKIVDPVSIKVQEQYEEHPYPRWRFANNYFPRNFFKCLNADIKPNKIESNNKFDNPNVLIAGCGTGKHTVQGVRYKNANILAIDLSLASLAYAKRKTEELKIKNIEYLHTDILQLKKLNKKFDIIESVGVLHHMKDPLAGLKVLVDILEPHGYLNLGLYSKIARRGVVKIRELIKQQNFKNTTKDIKTCRQEIINKKEDILMQKLLSARDFYSTSTVRDLLFHVQEHRFTIPQISKILQDFNLEFLGFTFSNKNIKNKFSKIFPDDKKNTSLDNWYQFETDNPDTFAGMYPFWVKKNDK